MEMAEDQKALVYEGRATSISVPLTKDMMEGIWFGDKPAATPNI